MKKRQPPQDRIIYAPPPGSDKQARLEPTRLGKALLSARENANAFFNTFFKGLGLGTALIFSAHSAGLLNPQDKNEDKAIAAASATDANGANTPACTRQMRNVFYQAANRVNLTGETGVALSRGYGVDDDCQNFAMPYQQSWMAMLARHEIEMRNPSKADHYAFNLESIRTELAEQHPGRINPNSVEGRRILLEAVNRYVNETINYTSDTSAFYQNDFFATPAEMFEAGNRGDCDDYMTMKYLLLRDLGVNEEDMYASIVGPRDEKHLNHAVLIVSDGSGDRERANYLLLNNDTSTSIIKPAHETDLRTYVAFNGSSSYVFVQALRDGGNMNLTSITPQPLPVATTSASAPRPLS